MRNETISRMFGMAVGAALVIGALTALVPRTTITTHSSTPQASAPLARLYASETVTVHGN